MAEVMLNSSRVLSVISELVAAAVPQHVAVQQEAEPRCFTGTRNHALVASKLRSSGTIRSIAQAIGGKGSYGSPLSTGPISLPTTATHRFPSKSSRDRYKTNIPGLSVKNPNCHPTATQLRVHCMQRISTWVRWIFTVIVAPIVTAVAVEFINTEHPPETANTVLKFLFDLSERTWFRPTALFLIGLVIGLWLDWLLRKLDGSRADQRAALGNDMLIWEHELEYLKDPSKANVKIMSCFITAKKLGILAPDERVFEIDPDRAYPIIRNYLTNVGQMLRDRHFSEAKRLAKKSKAGLRF